MPKTDLLMRRPHLNDVPGPVLPGGYELRKAGPEDEPSLAVTLAESFQEKWDEDRVRRELTGAGDVDTVFVITSGGAVVATASSRTVPDRFPGSGYVHWVGTSPEHLRRGLARALLIELLNHFGELGRGDAVLETQDFRHPAIRSYLRLGFTPVYEVKGEDHRHRWSAIFQGLFS